MTGPETCAALLDAMWRLCQPHGLGRALLTDPENVQVMRANWSNPRVRKALEVAASPCQPARHGHRASTRTMGDTP